MDENSAQKRISYTVPDEIEPERLDKYLGNNEELEISRSKAQKLILAGAITVDGQKVVVKHILSGGETIDLVIPPPPTEGIKGEDIPLDIVFEDEYLLVVNKPAGMVTHPGVGNRSGTLANALVFHFDKLSHEAGRHRPGVVHRLDRHTSGLLVVAKDDDTHVKLQAAIKDRELKRTYLALVCGHMKKDEGEIDRPIGRHPHHRTLMTVDGDSPREAQTSYSLLERFRSYDYLEVSLKTGRTHQIRVHFQHLGHPVFGDPDYGGRDKWVNAMFGPERPLAKRMLGVLERQALHAARLEFTHPQTGAEHEFEVPLPDDYASIMNSLRTEGV